MQNGLSLIELLDILDANIKSFQVIRRTEKRRSENLYFRHRKLKEFTGWEPLISPKEGTEKLIVWVRKPG